MTTRLVLLLVLALAAPLPAAAQVAASTPAPAVAPVAAQPPQAPQPAAATPAPRSRNEERREAMEAQRQRAIEHAAERQSKGVNVRIEATVIESKGEQVTGRKVLSVTTIDGGDWSSVRSTQQVPFHQKGMSERVVNWRLSPLNMDARAFLRDDGRIRVELTVEYKGGGNGGDTESDTIDEGIKQSVSAVLESGKPLVVAQSADAVGDRRVALEVKATVLK